jgi:hypothetical protein
MSEPINVYKAEYREHVVKTTHERNEIGPDADGSYYYWVKNRGALSAVDLRILADELDRLNTLVGSPETPDREMRDAQSIRLLNLKQDLTRRFIRDWTFGDSRRATVYTGWFDTIARRLRAINTHV